MKPNQNNLATVPVALRQPTTDKQPIALVSDAKNSVSEVWLALYFPALALNACHAPADRPFAVLEQVKGQAVIYAANALAQQQGVVAGIPLASAYALCHALKAKLRMQSTEAKLLQDYAGRAARFTPKLVLLGQDVLLLEVRASLSLFGGLSTLLTQLRECISAQYILSCTPVAAASALLARSGLETQVAQVSQLQSILNPLPLSVLAVGEKRIAQLSQCGVVTLQDVWRLPQKDLARRFGPELLDHMDGLLGKKPQPQVYYVPPTQFEMVLDLPAETIDCDLLLDAAKHLMEKLDHFLTLRGGATHCLNFDFIYAAYGHHAGRTASFKLLLQSQHAVQKTLTKLPQLSERLHNSTLERPVIAMSLKMDAMQLYVPNTQDMFDRKMRDQQSWSALIDLLAARVGSKHIMCLDVYEDHRPERAWQRVEINNQPGLKTKATARQTAGLSNERPFWLCAKPRAWRGDMCRLKRISENERIEAGWWQGQDVRRDYCKVETETGQRCWLYQDIVEPAQNQLQSAMQPRRSIWYLHGLFA